MIEICIKEVLRTHVRVEYWNPTHCTLVCFLLTSIHSTNKQLTTIVKMFKSVATWVLLASSAVYAAPAQVDIERRVVAKGLADFERLSTSSIGALGYYGGLKYTGIGMKTLPSCSTMSLWLM